MDDTNTQSTIEGETITSPTPTNNDALILLNLESLIKGHITNIEKLQLEARKHREMIEDGLAGDATYREHVERAKEANKVKAATRSQIMKQPSMITLSNKAKNAKAESRELEIELSEYLQEYQRLSGASEIEDEAGELREIINEAKLIKKASRK